MLRCWLSAILFLVDVSAFGQQRLTIDKSQIRFTSNAELEIIQASSDKLQGILDLSTNKFAFSIDIQSFKGFNSALQREHFNEKYLESEKFPKSTFTGKIIEELDLTKDGSYDVRAKGILDIHGVMQPRIIKGKIVVANGKVSLDLKFFVPLSDHNISIPQIVHQKIATEIEVSVVVTFIAK